MLLPKILCLALLATATLASGSYAAGPSAKKRKVKTTVVTYEQEPAATQVETTTTTIYDVEPAQVDEEKRFQPSSSSERKDKHILLSLGLMNASAGVYVDRNIILGVRYQRPYFTLGESERPDDASILSGFIEIFTGNNFYIGAGYGERRLRYDDLTFYHPAGTTTGSRAGRVRTVHYKDTGVDVGFGNRWQWRYFTLGVQWVGAYVKLTTPEVERIFVGDNDTLVEDKIRERNKRDDLTNPSLTSTISLGISF